MLPWFGLTLTLFGIWQTPSMHTRPLWYPFEILIAPYLNPYQWGSLYSYKEYSYTIFTLSYPSYSNHLPLTSDLLPISCTFSPTLYPFGAVPSPLHSFKVLNLSLFTFRWPSVIRCLCSEPLQFIWGRSLCLRTSRVRHFAALLIIWSLRFIWRFQ